MALLSALPPFRLLILTSSHLSTSHPSSSQGLLDCLFALSETSSRRGTARDTEFFLQEALDLARSTNSTVGASRALAGRALLSLLLGKEDECDSLVLQGRSVADTVRSFPTLSLRLSLPLKYWKDLTPSYLFCWGFPDWRAKYRRTRCSGGPAPSSLSSPSRRVGIVRDRNRCSQSLRCGFRDRGTQATKVSCSSTCTSNE